MLNPVVVIGIGEIGSVFARGFLKTGHPVIPVNRGADFEQVAAVYPHPELVLLAVGENDLAASLAGLPEIWSSKMVLVQNELLPRDFTHLSSPTVVSIWFEKKKGQDSKPIMPSPVFGPKSEIIEAALAAVDIPVVELDDAKQLEFELVAKNLYILTTNIAGIRTGGTVASLWQQHEAFARAVAADVIELQEGLTGHTFDRDALLARMLAAFAGDTEHKCMGRSATARLKRALDYADRLQLEVPTLREVDAVDLPQLAP